MTPITPTRTSICAIGTRDGQPETMWLTNPNGFVFGTHFDAAHQFVYPGEADAIVQKLQSGTRYQVGEGFIADSFETVPHFRS